MPPKTKMSDWNEADTINVNNCYNYATDNLNKAEPDKQGQPSDKSHPATPGATKDMDPWTQGDDLKLRITCTSLRAACVDIDNIKDEKHCEKNTDCWRIAYFIKKDEISWGDGFHFAREDKKAVPPKPPNPGEPAKWSHKMGHHEATDKCFNPATGRFDGPPITDPKNQKLFPGYEFCGYLCVCPDTKVAYLDPSKLIEEGESMVALFAYEKDSGVESPPALIKTAGFEEFAASALPGKDAKWIDGFGPGHALYRLDKIDEKGNTVQVVFISDESLTVWDIDIIHVPDPEGIIAQRVKSTGWAPSSTAL